MTRHHGWLKVVTPVAMAVFVLAVALQVSQSVAQPSDAAGQSSEEAGDLAEQLLEGAEESPLIEPTQTPPGTPPTATPTVPLQMDPRVLGTAPGQPRPTLRREGELIVNRRGRVVQDPNSNSKLFVLEADAKATPEPPMILMPCQMLQSMEDLVRDRGDKVVFILTGQIYVYRGANYLLPTMMKLAIDQGNLE